MPTAVKSPTTIRLGDALEKEVEARARDGFSAAVRDSLERYFSLLQRARLGLRDRFTRQECGLILDSQNGVMVEAWSLPMLAAGIEDSVLIDRLDERWQVNGSDLLAKLRSLSLLETAAVVDACERWWNGGAEPEGRYEEMFR